MGFGARWKKSAKGDVIGTVACDIRCQCKFVVTGHANDGLCAQQLAGGEDIFIVLAEMFAVGAGIFGELHIVVDDQQGRVSSRSCRAVLRRCVCR